MKKPIPPVMRVRDWDRLHENNRSRELGRTAWFPAPNDLGADWYAELVFDEDGAAHLGAWYALLMVASKATPRGVLLRSDGEPHTAESLARMTRLSEQLVKAAIERLLKIGLLELAGNKPRKKSNLRSHPGAGSAQDPARKPQDGAQKGREQNIIIRKRREREKNDREQNRTERKAPAKNRRPSVLTRTAALVLPFPRRVMMRGALPRPPTPLPTMN
jgi:hypothetical protein